MSFSDVSDLLLTYIVTYGAVTGLLYSMLRPRPYSSEQEAGVTKQ